MKTRQFVLLALSVITVSTVALILTKKRNVTNMLNQVADEGYELAQDVLYPLKSNRKGRGGFLPV